MMSKRKTEDYVVEMSGVFESSGDWLDDITEALNDRGIQAYVYKKEEEKNISNVKKMINDLVDLSIRLADEKEYDTKIAPKLQRIIDYLKDGENYEGN